MISAAVGNDSGSKRGDSIAIHALQLRNGFFDKEKNQQPVLNQ